MPKTYRKGAVGALMDEYERATAELVRILEGLSDEEYERVRDTETKDEDCRSIQTVTGHVIRAGRGYAAMLRDAWGIVRIQRQPAPVARADTRAELEAMLAYMVATLEGRWDLSEAESDAMQIRSGWGPVYDFEQLFEHAIVHVLRHRRQIERFVGR